MDQANSHISLSHRNCKSKHAEREDPVDNEKDERHGKYGFHQDGTVLIDINMLMFDPLNLHFITHS